MKLKELRIKENLTQAGFANKINIPRSTYNGYEQNISEPDINMLKTIADYYNVSLDYLCDHKTNHLVDVSGWNEYKKNIVKMLDRLNEKNDIILLGYITHMLQEQK